MAKGSKITTTDMQMRVLNGFDRQLRLSGQFTSGLMRNEPVSKWKTAPVTTATTGLTGADLRIAKLKAQIADMDRKADYRSYGK
jgi:hypothetical protein